MKSELGCPFCSIKDCDIIEEGKIDRHFTREATTKSFKKVKTC